VRAATTTLERVRRRAMPRRLTLEEIGELVAYSLGAYVWARFGNTRGVQLGRVRVAEPIGFGGPPEWWCVEIYWPTRGSFGLATWRRVLRALDPGELATLRADGVIPEASS
jgi:hypothetical protein